MKFTLEALTDHRALRAFGRKGQKVTLIFPEPAALLWIHQLWTDWVRQQSWETTSVGSDDSVSVQTDAAQSVQHETNTQHPSTHPSICVGMLSVVKNELFFRMSWKNPNDPLLTVALPSFPGGYSAPSLSLSRQHSHFLLVKQLKLVLGVCLKHLANWASSYPVRLRIFQRKKFWGWQQRVIFACPTAAFKEQTSLFFFLSW